MMTDFSFRMVRHTAIGAVVALAVLSPSAGTAQGALSVLGFGYPVGGQSSRSLGTGTSLSDLDPQSPVNPASIVLSARSQIYFQFEPEIRSVTAGGSAVSTTTERFPLFMITGHQSRATFALSFSSFTDRTWANSYPDTQVIGTERLPSTVLTQSEGGISDARLAFSWSFSDDFHAGIGLHVFPGQDRVVSGRSFPDSTKAGSFTLANNYEFSGSAASLGFVALPAKHLLLSGDLRIGGSIVMRLGDSTIVGRGKIPLKAGFTAAYDGIPGSIFSLRVGTDRWSDLKGLGTSSLGLQDATDVAFGTEIAGPRMSGSALLIRGGIRSRGLPYTYGSASAHETALSGGVGLPLFGGRSILDLGLVHASRTAGSVNESAWLVSVGFGVRP
jgi:hypothetical protein